MQPKVMQRSPQEPSTPELFEQHHARSPANDIVAVWRNEVPMLLAVLNTRRDKQLSGVVTLKREECQDVFTVQSSDEPRRCTTEASVTVVDEHGALRA